LLDFSKAFDTLDFDVLLIKLEKYYGFDSFACDLLRSYLNSRCQRVKCNGKVSALQIISSGVPQGSILGPILFSIFVNDIVHCCQNVSFHLYADDMQVYLSRPIGLSEDLFCRINDDLKCIYEWAQANNLKLNTSKTQALPIYHENLNSLILPDITINNEVVNLESCVTSLGFKLNRHLNCHDHVNHTVSKMYSVLRRLWSTASFLSLEVKLSIVKSLLVPILLYGGLVYGNLDAACNQKLQLVLNNAARYVFNLRKFDHISIYAKQILNCDVPTFFKVQRIIYLHKLIHTQSPGYLFEKLNFALSPRTSNLILPRANYLSTSRTFFVSAAKLWNSLPHDIKFIQSPALFKLAQ